MIDRMLMAKMAAALLLVVPSGKLRAESAQDYWPAWRGPTVSGVSTTAQPPLRWSETRNIKWKVPVPGKLNFVEEHLEAVKDIYASPVGAMGRVYFVGRNGTTEVVRNADKLEILATNKLDDGFDASPALAGNEIFLKGKRNLYCISAG